MTVARSLHVLSAGHPSNPPLLLLHGFLGAGGDWSAFTARWRERYFCCCVDLPGHGRSVGVPDRFYSMEGCAEGLARHLAALSEQPWRMVGYSMGGRLALHLLAQGQLPIAGAVLESCSPGLEREGDRAERLARDEAWAARLETEPMADWLRAWYAQRLFASLQVQPDLLQRLFEQRGRGQPSELARALRGLTVARQASLWDRLPELAVPLLWVAGELDPDYVAVARRAAGLSPAAGVSIVSHSGHVAHAEQPERFAAAVDEFLDALQRG